ncbi:MAG: ribosome maturation factor RimP [Oceanococcaceae bacterium]
MPLARDIEELLEPTVSGLGYELLCLEMVTGGKELLLRLYIDSEAGIGIGDCEKVSRAVSAQLEIDDPIAEAYRLEVSSPGWDRPLVKPEHFVTYQGHETKIKTLLPLDGRRNFRGRIVSVADGAVHIEVDGAPFVIRLDDIERARLVPESGPQA